MYHSKPPKNKELDISYHHQGKKKTMAAYADYVVDGGMHISGYILSVLGNRTVTELFQNGQLQAMLKGHQANEKQADEIAEEVVKETSTTDQYLERVEALMENGEPKRNALEAAKKRMNQLVGKGNPLNKNIRDDLEPRLGVDLSDVKIHNDSKANEMAEALNSRAFTHKNDIYFNKGEYNPDTNEGKKLLAHELAHTMQNSDGIQRKEKDETKSNVENGWFVTHENGSLFIEFKPPVTDEAIKIQHLISKIVGGTASSEQTQQIFDTLKENGVVKGSLWNSYTFKDTLVLDGLIPRGKVDVGYLYELEFLKKPEGKKGSEQEGGFFKAVGDFFKSIGDAYFQSLMSERDRGAAFSGKKSKNVKSDEKKINLKNVAEEVTWREENWSVPNLEGINSIKGWENYKYPKEFWSCMHVLWDTTNEWGLSASDIFTYKGAQHVHDEFMKGTENGTKEYKKGNYKISAIVDPVKAQTLANNATYGKDFVITTRPKVTHNEMEDGKETIIVDHAPHVQIVVNKTGRSESKIRSGGAWVVQGGFIHPKYKQAYEALPPNRSIVTMKDYSEYSSNKWFEGRDAYYWYLQKIK